MFQISLIIHKLQCQFIYLFRGEVVRYGHLAPLRGRCPLVEAALLLHEDHLKLWHLGNGEDVVQVEVDVALLEERIAQAHS